MTNGLFYIYGAMISFVGALPMGAVNLSVVQTTIQKDMVTAMKIAIAAGIAEILISYLALNYNVAVSGYLKENHGLQILISICIVFVGGFLLLKKQKQKDEKKRNSTVYNGLKGFLLALINPPVILFWLYVFSLLNEHMEYRINNRLPFVNLVLFFLGVYMGKVMALYLYSKFSKYIQKKINNVSLYLDKSIGGVLVIIGFSQVIKLTTEYL